MNLALKSTLGYTLEATHELLDLGSDALRFAPIPGLAEAARVLVTIWDSLQLVEVRCVAFRSWIHVDAFVDEQIGLSAFGRTMRGYSALDTRRNRGSEITSRRRAERTNEQTYSVRFILKVDWSKLQ